MSGSGLTLAIVWQSAQVMSGPVAQACGFDRRNAGLVVDIPVGRPASSQLKFGKAQDCLNTVAGRWQMWFGETLADVAEPQIQRL